MPATTYKTLILPASESSALMLAADLLRQGMVVAFPTDTVYGVGCDLWQVAAIERLYAAKQRPYSLAIPVLVAGHAVVSQVARDLSETFETLAQHFWPGELTLIVPRRIKVPDILCAGEPTIAVRMPNHEMLLRLLRNLGGALAVTSANISGQPSPSTAEKVQENLDGRIPLILDGGKCSGGVASTIVDCVSQPPVLLRTGNLSLEMLRDVLPDIVERSI
jgi:L-threonylcarbamoyladenylate synthase